MREQIELLKYHAAGFPETLNLFSPKSSGASGGNFDPGYLNSAHGWIFEKIYAA
jgi:hypothetical protein